MSPCHQPAKFLLLIHHGESLRKFPNCKYREGKTDMFDFVDIDYFSVDELDAMVLQLGSGATTRIPEKLVCLRTHQLEDEGLSFGGNELNSIFITTEVTFTKPKQPTVRRVISEYRVVRLRKGSAISFPLNNDYHPPSTFVSQTGKTSRTVNRKPNKKTKLRKRSHPSSSPEQMFASATQQMVGNQKRRSKEQNLSANREGRHKCINDIQPEQRKHVRLGAIIGMIGGNTNRKRLRKQLEPWTDNEISFPSMPGCQLVDSPIILEALIEGFLIRRIYVD
ncbi:hypothetical protein Tco_0345697 [Tanacetum coccineum]